MKVGFDTAPLAMNRAGEARYAAALLRALRRVEDLEVSALTLASRSPRNLLQRIAYQASAESLYYPLLVGRAARRAGCDLVHFPRNLQTPELTLRGPAVATIHDVLPVRHPELFSRVISLHHRLLVGGVAARATRVITDSDYSRNEIVELLAVDPERIDVVPLGVDERFRPEPAGDAWLWERFGISRPYVLCVGTIEPRKNMVTTLRAFERLSGIDEHSLVVIGGKGWRTDAFDDARRRSGARLVLTGYVTDQDLVRLYSSAQCFVFPSLYEGFGLPVLEAMACGTPVVTSRRASLPEVAGDAAVLVDDPTSADELARAIAGVLRSSTARDNLSARGIERARRYSWDDCARRTAAVYARALKEHER